MISKLKTQLAIWLNRFKRRKGPSLQDQCMKVIMHACSLHLEREEARELAPATGMIGPVKLSGGAITKLTYKVFDRDADKIDPTIRTESWRAFAEVTLLLATDQDPQFEVKLADLMIEPRSCHKAPGLSMVYHLATYFPLLPRPYVGATYKPLTEAAL